MFHPQQMQHLATCAKIKSSTAHLELSTTARKCAKCKTQDGTNTYNKKCMTYPKKSMPAGTALHVCTHLHSILLTSINDRQDAVLR